jgi:hypothetical protein
MDLLVCSLRRETVKRGMASTVIGEHGFPTARCSYRRSNGACAYYEVIKYYVSLKGVQRREMEKRLKESRQVLLPSPDPDSAPPGAARFTALPCSSICSSIFAIPRLAPLYAAQIHLPVPITSIHPRAQRPERLLP